MCVACARFPDTQNHEKAFSCQLFQKKWCWRLSFEVHLFVFRRMLQLILLFLLKNCLWVTRSPKGYQGGIWAAIWSDMGADFPGWLALDSWLVVCQPPSSWLAVCKSPTSWLVVCKPPTSWLAVCKPLSRLVGGLQTTNHGAQIPPW